MKFFGFLVFFLNIVCGIHSLDDCNGIKDWTHSQVLDRSEKVRLEWKINNDTISMMVVAKTTGWIGLGFSPSGSMKGADLVMGWVKDGKIYLQDRYALQNGRPLTDEQQDYELLGGSETNSTTTLCFKRKLNTCDKNDFIITSDTIRMIWALNDEDPESELYEAPKYHSTNRGVKSLYLITGSFETPSLHNVTALEVRMPNVSIPIGFSDIYWCRVFRFPKMQSKHHMIGYKPYITEGNEDLIHHFLVYECNGPNVNELLDPYLNESGYLCYSPEMPLEFFMCRQTLVTWAVGSEGIFLPSVAGYPLGDRNGGYTYLMFEMHYNNPTPFKEIIDSSGITLYYTSELRQHDAGVLMMGVTVGSFQVIPPYQDSFPNIGHCSQHCTQEKFPEEGVKAFGVMLHSHLIGKSITLRHFRGDKELPPIADNKHYDFNYQQEQLFQEEILLLPNDTMTTECIYDSSKRNLTTFGGESTEEEMCLSMIMYYPKVDLSWCTSHTTHESFFKILGMNETVLSHYPNYYLLKHQLEIRDWTKEEIKRAKETFLLDDKLMICLKGDGQLMTQGYPPLVNYLPVDPYIPPPDDVCPSPNLVNNDIL